MSLAYLLVAVQLRGQVSDAPGPSHPAKELAEETLKLAKEEAAKFEFQIGEDGGTNLKLLPQSVLRWSNPVIGSLYGTARKGEE